jgi:hypothetical protein
MTEAEWLAAANPEPLLEFLQAGATARKLRLFAAAAFDRLKDLLPHTKQHGGIRILEKMAEGKSYLRARRGARKYVLMDWRGNAPTGDPLIDDPDHVALMLYRAIVSTNAAGHAETASRSIRESERRRAEQCELLRDIFGNPFRPVAFDPRWRSADAVGLARGIYDERAFERLPLLTDALMDAGCADDQVLSHCRSEGPHVRGCWVVDLILSKDR